MPRRPSDREHDASVSGSLANVDEAVTVDVRRRQHSRSRELVGSPQPSIERPLAVLRTISSRPSASMSATAMSQGAAPQVTTTLVPSPSGSATATAPLGSVLPESIGASERRSSSRRRSRPRRSRSRCRAVRTRASSSRPRVAWRERVRCSRRHGRALPDPRRRRARSSCHRIDEVVEVTSPPRSNATVDPMVDIASPPSFCVIVQLRRIVAPAARREPDHVGEAVASCPRSRAVVSPTWNDVVPDSRRATACRPRRW